MYPLMPLQMTTCSKAPRTYLTDVGLRFTLCRSRRSVLPFATFTCLCPIRTLGFDKVGRRRHGMHRIGKSCAGCHVRWGGVEWCGMGISRRHGGCLRRNVAGHIGRARNLWNAKSHESHLHEREDEGWCPDDERMNDVEGGPRLKDGKGEERYQ
jgi:hypothetical protein